MELPKTEEGLGFNVMGGKEQNSPIYISRIIPGGVAERHGGLKRGDQLLSVNGVVRLTGPETEYGERDSVCGRENLIFYTHHELTLFKYVGQQTGELLGSKRRTGLQLLFLDFYSKSASSNSSLSLSVS